MKSPTTIRSDLSLPSDLHQALKSEVAVRRTTMKAAIENGIRLWLSTPDCDDSRPETVPPSTKDGSVSLPNLNEELIISLESVAQQLSAVRADVGGALAKLKQERQTRAQKHPKEEADGEPVTDNAAATGERAVVERVQETVAKLSRRPTGNRKSPSGGPGYAGKTVG